MTAPPPDVEIGARDVVERYLREVVNGVGPARPEDLVSSEPLRQKLQAFRAAFPDLRVAAHQLLVEAEMVGVFLTGRGTHLGIFQGVPPTGRSWSASCTALYRIENGKIVDSWVSWDLLGILEQIGAVQRSAASSA